MGQNKFQVSVLWYSWSRTGLALTFPRRMKRLISTWIRSEWPESIQDIHYSIKVDPLDCFAINPLNSPTRWQSKILSHSAGCSQTELEQIEAHCLLALTKTLLQNSTEAEGSVAQVTCPKLALSLALDVQKVDGIRHWRWIPGKRVHIIV